MTHTTRPTITPTANLAGADLDGATLTGAIITDLITQITVSH